MRTTRQRGAILQTIEHAERPLSAAEVLTLARDAVPGLGLATVYRTIDALVSCGAIAAVEIPGKPPRYEIAGKDHHHHFLCKACHRVFEVHGCPGHLDMRVPSGFVLEGHEITLFGRCDRCAPRAGLKQASRSGRASAHSVSGSKESGRKTRATRTQRPMKRDA